MLIGNRVVTVKGGRMKNEGPFEGVIVGFGHWKNFPAVNVKKSNGRVVQCLRKNLKLAECSKTTTNNTSDAIALLKEALEAFDTDQVNSFFMLERKRINAVLAQQRTS